MTGPKILTLDIETSPNLSWHFDSYKVDIRPIQNVEPSRIICWSAKWADEKTVLFRSEMDEGGRTSMLCKIAGLMDEADIICTYNGDNFDLPRLKWAFQLHDIEQPSPFISADLFKVVKYEFGQAPMSRSLAYIVDQLHVGAKLEVGGYFPIWLDMNSPDEKVRERAWRKFTRYSKRDTKVTDDLRIELQPYLRNLPSAALWDEEGTSGPLVCSCGSEDVQKRGYYYTKTRRYPRYYCKDCHKWGRGTHSDRSVGLT